MLVAGKALSAAGMSLVNTQADSLVSHHLLPRGWGGGWQARQVGQHVFLIRLESPDPRKAPASVFSMIGGQEQLMALRNAVSPTP